MSDKEINEVSLYGLRDWFFTICMSIALILPHTPSLESGFKGFMHTGMYYAWQVHYWGVYIRLKFNVIIHSLPPLSIFLSLHNRLLFLFVSSPLLSLKSPLHLLSITWPSFPFSLTAVRPVSFSLLHSFLSYVLYVSPTFFSSFLSFPLWFFLLPLTLLLLYLSFF